MWTVHPAPVIGITSYVEQARWGVWDLPAVVLPFRYVERVEAAGGRAVVLPPTAAADDAVLDILDGVVFAGGADLDPALYGEQAHAETTGLRPERDAAELPLMRAALDRDLPTLGICRGMQLLTVVSGGSLVQHLPDAVGPRAAPAVARRLRPARRAARAGQPGARHPRRPGQRPVVPPPGHRLAAARSPSRGGPTTRRQRSSSTRTRHSRWVCSGTPRPATTCGCSRHWSRRAGLKADYAPAMAEDTYTVTRSTTIDAPPARVYEEIADFHNWTHWSPWEDLDPDLKRTYSGSESGKGAAYAWSGNRKAGQGRMEMTEATPPSTVRVDLAFEKGLGRLKATTEGRGPA